MAAKEPEEEVEVRFRVDGELGKWLDSKADEQRLSRNAYVRQLAVQQFLNEKASNGQTA